MNTSRLALVAALALIAPAFAGCGVDQPTDDGTSTEEVGGTPDFQLWQDDAGAYYFHLRAGNHAILVTSQSYSSRTAALGGLLSVLDNGGASASYHVLTAANNQHYFVLDSANKQVLATSETYSTSTAANKGVTATITAVGAYLQHWATATGARFDVFAGTDGRYYFDLYAANGEIVLQSQGYSTKAAALNGTFSVEDNGLSATSYTVQPASDGGFYFNLKASNGQVIGASEVYSTQYDAQRGRDAMIALLPQIKLL